MGKHKKDPALEGKKFDQLYANSQARAAAKEKLAPLPPKKKDS